jgi:integrase
MKPSFRLFRRNSGIWFWENRQNGQQGSLRTTDKAHAIRLLSAKNEAEKIPAANLPMAKVYANAADPMLSKRTWRGTFEQIIKLKHGENRVRWGRAMKDRAFKGIMDLSLIETRADNFLAVMNAGTVSTNVFLRRLHNFALGMGWLLAPVLPPKQWPEVRHQPKRAITLEEHQKIIAREHNPERRAFYELLWELGGAQGDVAKLCAEDVDWGSRTLSYFRAKTGRASRVRFDQAVEEILRSRPSQGLLFPYLGSEPVRASDRATEFRQRCNGLGIKGVTLHSYRYSWAERAREAGYPERSAQEVLGHGSKAVHRAYARNASPELVTIGAWQKRQAAGNVIPLEFNKSANRESAEVSATTVVGTS